MSSSLKFINLANKAKNSAPTSKLIAPRMTYYSRILGMTEAQKQVKRVSNVDAFKTYTEKILPDFEEVVEAKFLRERYNQLENPFLKNEFLLAYKRRQITIAEMRKSREPRRNLPPVEIANPSTPVNVYLNSVFEVNDSNIGNIVAFPRGSIFKYFPLSPLGDYIPNQYRYTRSFCLQCTNEAFKLTNEMRKLNYARLTEKDYQAIFLEAEGTKDVKTILNDEELYPRIFHDLAQSLLEKLQPFRADLHFTKLFTESYIFDVLVNTLVREMASNVMRSQLTNLEKRGKVLDQILTQLRENTGEIDNPQYIHQVAKMVDGDINKENEEEPDFSDPEDYYDGIADDDLVPDVLRQQPRIDQYEECCTIVFGIPVVGAERMTKLHTVLTKILNSVDVEHKLFLPPTPEGGSKGCMFVEWKSKEKAEYCKNVLQGYKLDKSHTFTVLLFDEMRRVEQPPADWQAPEPVPFSDVGDLWWWMQHNRCRDQFAVQYEKNGCPTVGVYWHIKGHDPELAGDQKNAERPNWTDTVFKWSPHGSYLLTIHAQGALLWAGQEYKRFQRFAHRNVQYIDFSPRENYIVTFAPPSDKMMWGDDEDCIRIWDVKTGEMKKGFSLYALTNRNELPTWPLFKWSHDEKFFACLKAPEKDKLEKEKKINGISVFDTESFSLVDKRHVIIENINSFDWSPSDNVIAYYSECSDTLPAEFGLMQIPSQHRLRTGRIYNVAEAQMWWQASGKRLAVYTKRYSKKTTKAETGEVKYIGGCTYHLEIFEMDRKDVSLMNLPLPEPFINFAWEPNGEKFAVLTGNQNKATPNVYKIDSKSPNPLKLMSKLDAGVQFNEVQWAPSGQWLAVLAKLSAGGNVMFVDTTLAEAKRTNVIEHPGFNKGYWDPTGRYFVTCTTLGGRLGADLGFRIFTFQGRELCRKGLERLSQFQWRPRPPVKLSEQKLKEIKKNLKKTATRFEREDNDEKYRASQEVVEKRRKIMSQFNVIRERNLREFAERRAERIDLRNGVDTEDKALAEDDLVEEQIMIALSTEKTLAPPSDDVDWRD